MMAPQHNCTKEVELTTLQLNNAQMSKDIAEIKNDIREIKEYITKEMDRKYASKLTEVIVYLMCGSILI